MCLADCFPDVSIATPVAVVPESPVEIPGETENNKTSPDKATPFEAEDSEMSADRGALPNNNPQSEEKSVEVGYDTAPLQKGINPQPSNVLPNDTTVNSKAVEDEGELQYISKYLFQFVPDTRSQNKEQTVRISGARVLTGDKCAEILKDHEQKKQKEKEEKEKRKLLREQKKKEKEEELKKKKSSSSGEKKHQRWRRKQQWWRRKQQQQQGRR